MDEMDRYPHMKGHYLVMNNAHIHTFEDIAKYVESRGYRCAYLPPYSPELNPIEQFWSVIKSKVSREGNADDPDK
ncbi:Putative Piso0_000048 protein [Rhizopus microsporus]|nr:Putative Piso0_000048 protein [Rhizopus microsporus]